MKGSYQIAVIKGIPIRVHITLLILLPLMAMALAPGYASMAFLFGLLAAVGVFASIALHELGHSLVARAKGCQVREILLLPIGGVAQLDRMPRLPRDEFQVAIAGPLVSLLLSILFSLAFEVFGRLELARLAYVVERLSWINMVLMLFNLLPSFPMDGGRIFRAWLAPKLGRLEATRIAVKVGRFMAIVFGLVGLFTWNLFLIVIAFFIYQAAGAEYRMVRIQEAQHYNMSGAWPVSESPWPINVNNPEIHVSPPPYRRGGPSSTFFARPLRAQHDLFDELFQKWR